MNQSKNFRMDSSEWELSKENVQPIKQGRKVPNLMAGLAPNGEDAHWKLQKDKQSFEAEIRIYDGEDALDVWYRYVLWIEENIPKGGREISTLLERCIQQFKDVTKYKCDERYLQVWIKYADCCIDPLDVFNYMHSQGISCDLPLFYITWASACENAGNYKKADQVLTLAIERNVQPRDMLKKYHIGFQHRLTTYLVAKDDDDEMESLNSGRSTLGSLKVTGKKKSVPALRTANVYNHQADNTGNSSGNSQNVASSFSVFKDSDNENRAAAGLPDVHGDWKEPPAQSIISKENVDLPGKWTKGKPSSRSGGSSVSSVRTVSKPNFHVHVEENAAQQNTCGSQVIGSQVLASRKPDSKEMNDPLKDIVKNEDDNKVSYKEMYDKRKVYTGTEEFQFEEIRAAKYVALTKHSRPLPAAIRRTKREQVGPTHDAEENREKRVYQKEKVYAYEGEFQPEEIMARLFYERGGRLRLKKPKVHEACSVNERTSSVSLDLRPDTTASKEVERNLTVHTNDDFVKYDDKENPPKRKIKYTDENSDRNPRPSAVACNPTEKQLVERFSALDVARHALKEVTQLPIPDEKSDNDPSRFALCSKLPRVPVTPSKLSGPSPTLLTKQALGDVMPWFNTTIGLNDSDTEFEAKFKNDPDSDNNLGLFGTELDGKYVFAGVGRENAVDGMEDENEENVPPIGYVQPTFGRPNLEILQPSLGFPIESLEERQSREEENRQFIAEYEDCFNPVKSESAVKSESTVKSESPVRSQNAVKSESPVRSQNAVKSESPVRSQNAVKSESTVKSKSTVKSESTASLKYETNKLYDDDITDYQLQFTAAARLASSPFEGQADLRALPTFHCSTIHSSTDLVGASEQIEETPYTAETEPAPFNIPPPSSFNTPSKGLSPILECSDEDGKKERSRDVTVHSPNGDVLRVVNPFDPEICNDLLSKLSEPVNTFSGYHDLKDKPMAKMTASKAVYLGEHLYRVGKNIGCGAFAKVFSAKRLNVDWTKDDEEEDDNSRTLALKVQAPANEWEFYVCSELHRRLKRLGKSEDELSTLVKIEDFYVYADGSCGVTKLHEKGTFLDLVNYYKGHRLNESVAVYYAIEFMKILECVHEVGIIHGDIKPDNLVIIGENSDILEKRGVALIDFGCAIDIRLFPPGTRFSLKNNTESFECIEMKTGRPWTTQVDTYGMLGCLHCLIFGEYMKVYERNGRWRTMKSINRSWNRNLWTKLFDVFLNVPSCDELPSVKVIYEEFRDYFDRNLKSSFSACINAERNAYM